MVESDKGQKMEETVEVILSPLNNVSGHYLLPQK